MKNNVLTPGLADAMVRVTELAAIAASAEVGRGDEKKADAAAVDAMRSAFNEVEFRGRVVIGEGERDEAPMLYIGEEVGTGKGPEIDIALDPLEGTTLTAKAMANALAVLAIAPRGGLLYAPDTYMDKIAIGPGYAEGLVSLDATPAENIKALAKAAGRKIADMTVCVLDRPRHEDIIESLRSAGARIALITDGDVAGVIATTNSLTGIDMYVGSGGAPEGVLAAAALKCVGGQMFGRLVFRNDDEKKRAAKTGISDFGKTYSLNELASGDTVFCATGVTNGTMLNGVLYKDARVHTHTLVMTSTDGMVRYVRSARKV
ncbi:MAG: class II fructose-bisphosphatase [Hyphomonas sp.]|uniref:class II fructose-bisphosphatase n=1 Tax=Hyphomonas sp. TaxID=87 RepID=UPI00183217B5|nr:class II fructose-bisphosphatase [Hyphomonas sp.]MBU3919775.1 class II fructose-bisphosphatase [Alphaproteobacteria bacterium]MBA3067532.1 class II fructose-bisphosphatase [Hyphomonas sp.]MBU4063420.1 class II fructose-bisphosphatase [Alphaproteobacteria bacterium]MBU4165241.1 class II fructose-bisphosphatase [Alphaproteobacteria bacterium]MBU4568490.1 class II fructose-bisphosphatase [Alphaproteobacteria bacterium]